MGIEARRRSLDRVESDPLSILLGVGGEVGSSCEQTREKKKRQNRRWLQTRGIISP